MNIKRYIAAVLGVFVFLFLYQWLIHGVLLTNMYATTPTVWRELSDMRTKMPWGVCFQALLAAWITFVFTRVYPKGGWSKGLILGLYFGVFAAILSACWYLWLPISAKLAFSWFIASFVETIGAGYILGSIYHK